MRELIRAPGVLSKNQFRNFCGQKRGARASAGFGPAAELRVGADH
jgi:hypothetical protein